jgi:transcriptional regulator with XRE-family HTH domain
MRAANRDGPDPIDVAVGGQIRSRRRALSLSQTQLAQALGITFQQVQKYERGANRVSASMLVKIAAKLETTVAALVEEDLAGGAGGSGALGKRGAADLVAAFARIPEPDTRRALLAVIRALSPKPEGPSRMH